jgi:hypothetical protein
VSLDNATEDSAASEAVEPPDEQCVASAILWLPVNSAPSRGMRTP